VTGNPRGLIGGDAPRRTRLARLKSLLGPCRLRRHDVEGSIPSRDRVTHIIARRAIRADPCFRRGDSGFQPRDSIRIRRLRRLHRCSLWSRDNRRHLWIKGRYFNAEAQRRTGRGGFTALPAFRHARELPAFAGMTGNP
jgi:hypothetical protein